MKYQVCEKDYVCNASSCDYEINKDLKCYTYKKHLINDSVVTCDDAAAKSCYNIPELAAINSNYKEATFGIDYYILHPFLLATILLLKSLLFVITV